MSVIDDLESNIDLDSDVESVIDESDISDKESVYKTLQAISQITREDTNELLWASPIEFYRFLESAQAIMNGSLTIIFNKYRNNDELEGSEGQLKAELKKTFQDPLPNSPAQLSTVDKLVYRTSWEKLLSSISETKYYTTSYQLEEILNNITLIKKHTEGSKRSKQMKRKSSTGSHTSEKKSRLQLATEGIKAVSSQSQSTAHQPHIYTSSTIAPTGIQTANVASWLEFQSNPEARDQDDLNMLAPLYNSDQMTGAISQNISFYPGNYKALLYFSIF